MKRSPLHRVTPLQSSGQLLRRVPLRRVSRKRAREQRAYSAQRVVFLASHPRCEFPGGCVSPAVEVHHMRGRVGDRFLDMEWWKALCTAHHEWVTGHPAAAEAMGLSASRVGLADRVSEGMDGDG